MKISFKYFDVLKPIKYCRYIDFDWGEYVVINDLRKVILTEDEVIYNYMCVRNDSSDVNLLIERIFMLLHKMHQVTKTHNFRKVQKSPNALNWTITQMPQLQLKHTSNH